ncbi:hypothetical protein ES703_17370 [subsurface metagenome]
MHSINTFIIAPTSSAWESSSSNPRPSITPTGIMLAFLPVEIPCKAALIFKTSYLTMYASNTLSMSAGTSFNPLRRSRHWLKYFHKYLSESSKVLITASSRYLPISVSLMISNTSWMLGVFDILSICSEVTILASAPFR